LRVPFQHARYFADIFSRGVPSCRELLFCTIVSPSDEARNVQKLYLLVTYIYKFLLFKHSRVEPLAAQTSPTKICWDDSTNTPINFLCASCIEKGCGTSYYHLSRPVSRVDLSVRTRTNGGRRQTSRQSRIKSRCVVLDAYACLCIAWSVSWVLRKLINTIP
jgi:hypothetical protein